MSARKVEPEFGCVIDISGSNVNVTTPVTAGIMPAFGYSNPVYHVGYDWLFWRITYVSSAGAPTEVTFQPESLDLLDPLTAGADWAPLPYEPAASGTGLVEFFDYQPYRTIWAAGTVKVVRTPAFEGWMRLGIAVDAGAESLFSVRAMRQRVGGPKAGSF